MTAVAALAAAFLLVVVSLYVLHQAAEDRKAAGREAIRLVAAHQAQAAAERNELIDRLMFLAARRGDLPEYAGSYERPAHAGSDPPSPLDGVDTSRYIFTPEGSLDLFGPDPELAGHPSTNGAI